MSAETIIIIAALVAGGACLLAGLAGLWLTRSWQVLDDDQLSEKFSLMAQSPAAWPRLNAWFRRKPPRLTYRRDERGRFRRVRR